ncbi:hypothetical protein A3715_15375 [Oleiphilus sp. HI0009]|nr:hypothetical protein A3715_15375 [Oleiphilus sp. HI0009]
MDKDIHSVISRHGITTFRIDQGSESGRNILLIHGGSMGSWEFNSIKELLKRDGNVVYRYDMLGHGLSERPKGAFTFDMLVEQGIDFIDKIIRDKKFEIIGHSLGGAVSAAILKERYEKITHAHLVTPMLNFSATNPVSSVMKSRFLGYPFMTLIGRHYLKYRRKDRLKKAGATDLIPEFNRQYNMKGYWQSILKMEQHGILECKKEVYASIKGLEHKVTIYEAENDKIIPHKDINEICEALGPNHKRMLIEKTGHNVFITHSKIIKDIIENRGKRLNLAN